MKPGRRVVLTLFMLALCATGASAETTVLRVGKLVTGAGAAVSHAVVVVDGERIAAVGDDKTAIPAGAHVVDLSRFTLMPGLIDLHTHITYVWDRTSGSRPIGQPARPTAVTVFLAQDNARKTLEAGVTTIRDLGAQDYADIAMRTLINRGLMVGPRMFVAGYGLSITRGAPRPARPPVAAPMAPTM